MPPMPPMPTSGPRQPNRNAWPEFGSDEDLAATVQIAPSPDSDRSPRTPVITPPPSGDLSYSTFPAGVSGRAHPRPSVPMPRPGDTFFGFRLVEELGHGTFARVFLAKQDSLAGRDVALKVTLRPTREAERLARLQHTNIVPVYSVHTAASIQFICMPYLGRRTLADLILGYRRSQNAIGQSTRKVLGAKKGSTTLAGSRSKTGLRDPASAVSGSVPAVESDRPVAALVGDVEAVLRILSGLADGLAHAHARGVLHLDLKPGNVLLPDDGEPMLLDFNLSFDAAEPNREVIGGTIPYMAPEQLIDLRSRGKGEIDARTDLYSLGVMAFELLTGANPFSITAKTLADFDGLMAARKKGPRSLREANPDVTPAVEAIVRKLLAPDPAERYQSAAELREDVDRQLADRPLRFAPDRSVPERVSKWRRRNPWALGAMILLGVLALAGGAGAVAHNRTEALADAEGAARARRTREGLDSVRLDLVLSGDPAARQRGTDQVVDRLREYGLPEDPNWRQKEAFRRVPEGDRQAVAGDLGEMLLLLAHVRWEDGRKTDRQGAATDALQLNRLAESCFTSSSPPFMTSQRAELEAAIGGDPADPPPLGHDSTARDHFLTAVELIGKGKYATAVRPLERAITDRPDHAAAHFCLAYCRHQFGQYTRAVERYDTARVLMPTDARPFFYRGVAFGCQGKPAAAEEEFTRAIELDRKYGDAYRNRGVARLGLNKNREAEQDLTEALARDVSPIQVHLLRAQARDRLNDPAGAKTDREAAGEYRPERADDFLVRGVTRLPKDPAGSLADFEAAANLNPRSLNAWQNQAHVLSGYLADDAGALAAASRAAELYPECGVACAGKAVLLARLGRRQEAQKEAERIRLLCDDPKVTYQLGCVYAVTAATHAEDREKAFALLRQAFRDGYRDVATVDTDPDLAPIRNLPEFAPLAAAVRNLTR
ncbi:MAG: serine/threonine protein kinase, partial [Gemmataceae bacterium]|nr:serine/threonine protein kinase [Gemmataceae bacterium]